VIQSGFQMASTCPACNGAGQSVSAGDECGSCEGVGRVRSRKTIEVKVPAGVDDGAKIRMEGQGDVPLQGAGTPGSLYVRIGVRPSKVWRRQGSNLYYPATVPFHTAILGGKVRVPTLEGIVDVRVPSGTQVGDEMLLRGRGVPNIMRRGDKGDLLVQFEVTIPRSLTKRQKEILQQYVDDIEGRRPAPPTAPTSAPPPSTPPPPPHSQTQTQAQTQTPEQSASQSETKTAGSPSSFTSAEPKEAKSTSSESKEAGQKEADVPPSPSAVEGESQKETASEEGEFRERPQGQGKGVLNSLWSWFRGKRE
jgi:molecular chaperone DnaJ